MKIWCAFCHNPPLKILYFIVMEIWKYGSLIAVLIQEFFNALARTKQIHDDCKMLLRSKQQTAGRPLHQDNNSNTIGIENEIKKSSSNREVCFGSFKDDPLQSVGNIGKGFALSLIHRSVYLIPFKFLLLKMFASRGENWRECILSL